MIPGIDAFCAVCSWTKSQVRARAHPNVLAASAWLNKFYHLKGGAQGALADVDLAAPLSYADRFRMRHPGNQWHTHPPHIDGEQPVHCACARGAGRTLTAEHTFAGGGIERWEDGAFRSCFADILGGAWRAHDPYDLEGRINARSSLYGRPNQARLRRARALVRQS